MFKKILIIIGLVYLVAFPAEVLSQLADTPWPKFHHDLRNTGKTENFGTTVGKLKWEFITGGAVTSSPSMDSNGMIYIGSEDNNFYVINAETGALEWKYTTGGAIERSSPAIDVNGVVYIGSNDGYLYAFDTTTIDPLNPKEKWKFKTKGAVNSSPTIHDDGTIFFTSNDGYLYALTPSGTPKWSKLDPRYLASRNPARDPTYIGASWVSPAIDTDLDQIYTASWRSQSSNFNYFEYTFDNETFLFPSSVNYYAFDISTGNAVWDFPGYTIEFCVPGGVNASPVIAPDGSIIASYFITFKNPSPCKAEVWKYNVFLLDPYTGYAQWGVNLEGDADIYGTPAVLEDNSFFIPANKNIHRILPDTTSYLAVQIEGDRVECSPAVDGQMLIFVGSNNGRFYCMCANCPETPILWQYPAEDQDPLQEISLGGTISLATIISSPAIGDDERHSIYVGSSSGSVFAFYDGPRISGRAVLVAADGETKSPFRAVKMTLTSEFETKERVTYTDTNGYYEFAGVENYAYTVTPEKFGYVFGPQSATAVVKQDQDAKNIDFEAFTGFTISGTINDSANSIPVSGVAVTIDGVNTVPASTVTDASGQYAFTGLSFDTYSITPSLQGYGFTPPFQQVTIASDDAVKDKTNIDFTATRGYQISGKVIDIAVADEVDNGIQGVNISLTGAVTASATTDANGAYSFVGLENGTYTVTPRFINYSFEPASQTVTVASGHVNNLDFFAATGSSISGYILDLDNATLANVTVGLYDATRRTSFITQDQEDEPRNTVHPLGSGRYVFIGVGSGTYTIKPRLAGHGFEPLSRTVTLAASDVSDQNFNGSPGLYIGGKVVNLLGMGASGVEVLLNEGSAKTETTSDGSYSFTGLSAGKYTVAVNPDAHSARPLSISVELVGEGKENNNFLLTASSECPQVYFNFPFFGSYKQLVNIYGLYFGMSKPPEDELVTVGDSGVTLKSGVYFGTEDPETWVRAEVEFWSPVKIVVNSPDIFGFVYTWVIYLNEKDSGCYTTPYPTNFYLGF